MKLPPNPTCFNPLRAATEEIMHLMQTNAKHRRGYCINDQNDQEILEHLESEVKELMDAPNDKKEMGDIIGIAIHYCLRKGWSLEAVGNEILDKLKERFTIE